MHDKGIGRALGVVALALVCAGTARAQPAQRPAAGAVFGGASASTSGKALDLTVDINESYDQNVTVRSGPDEFSLFQGSGAYVVLTPNLDFVSHGNRVQWAMNAGSNGRYYSDTGEVIVTNESGAANLSVRLSSSTTMSLNQSVAYSASPFAGLFVPSVAPEIGSAAPPTSNYSLDAFKSYTSATGASVTHRISPRATLSFASDLGYTATPRTAGYPSVQNRDVGGRIAYSLSRDLHLQFGYTFRQGQYEGSPRSTQHDLNIGIDYSRPLSRTRKTAISFMLGPTVASVPLTVGSQDVRRQYRLIGDASLRHQVGRTWALQASYRRGIGNIEGFQAPVFTAAYSASASGFLGRRTDLSLSAAYSTGESALTTGTPDQFATYTGDARLRIAMTRMWATYVEYLFYDYNFNRTVLAAGLPPSLTRNGVRTGVTMWIPVRRR